MQYSLNEITLLPSSNPTDINSRSEVNPFKDGLLPIFVAPMTSIINKDNFNSFIYNRVIPVLPRNIKFDSTNPYWQAVSLSDFNEIIDQDCDLNNCRILIDIANGHMSKIYDLVKLAKQRYPKITIMVGNIAHPNMYLECWKAGVDYVRVGIGGGTACITSVKTGIHTSHVWLIEEIKKIQETLKGYKDKLLPKTIADGGINTIDKAIKCLAIGYDYVMMGKYFAQCEESCGETALFDGQKRRKYYGMASEQGQIDISGGVNKNPEGIEIWVPVSYTLESLTKQFEASLRSTMSYVGAHNLDEFKQMTKYDIMSLEEFKSYYK